MANLEAAQDIQKRTRSLLSQYHHNPGTRTPSPKGQPPAEISGRLLASVQAEHDGDDAIVGPTRSASSGKGPYGRFLELGGTHHASTGPAAYPGGPPQMWWREDGFWYHAGELEKGPRPYLKPATDDAIESGAVYDIYWRHWLVAQEAVTS